MYTFWLILLGVFVAGHLVLEGADYGAGLLLPFVGRDEAGRDLVVRSFAPLFLGNEVWLVAAAGTLIGAFPRLESALETRLYPVFVLILAGWLIRDAGLWFRRQGGSAWRAGWDTTVAAGSAALCLGWGALLGNLALGVPPTATPLGPLPVLCGVAFAALCALHGATYLSLRLPTTQPTPPAPATAPTRAGGPATSVGGPPTPADGTPTLPNGRPGADSVTVVAPSNSADAASTDVAAQPRPRGRSPSLPGRMPSPADTAPTRARDASRTPPHDLLPAPARTRSFPADAVSTPATRARLLAARLPFPVAGLVVVVVVALAVAARPAHAWPLVLLAGLLLAGAAVARFVPGRWPAMVATAVGLAALVPLLVAAGLPTLPAGLSVGEAADAANTLGVLAAFVVPVLPIMVACQASIWWLSLRRVEARSWSFF